MTDSNDRRLGSSGIFKALVMSARKLKRALSDSDDEDELPPIAEDLGGTIATALMTGELGQVHALGTATLRQRTSREAFIEQWSAALGERGKLTGFEVSNAGKIELQYVPGLEDVPQSQFVAFLELVFGTGTVPLDDEKAFAIGVVVLFDEGQPRIGAIHVR